MMDHMNDVPDDVEIPNTEQIPDSQNNQSEHEISQNYEGAPEMVWLAIYCGFSSKAVVDLYPIALRTFFI